MKTIDKILKTNIWREWRLYPIYFIIGIVPLIVKEYNYPNPLTELPWYWDGQGYDLFLYWKAGGLIIGTITMVLMLFFSSGGKKNPSDIKKNKFQRNIFISLGIWMLLSGASAVLSKYRYFVLHGSADQFESIYVIFAYGIIVYYCYKVLYNVNKIKPIIQVLFISCFFISLIGFTQVIGYDFFRFIFHKKELEFNFESGRVYGPFYNPNYVGSYAALILPIFFLLFLKCKEKCHKITMIGIVSFILINLIGSKSATGFFSVGLTFLILFIFLFHEWKVPKTKKICWGLSIISICILILLIFGGRIKETYLSKLYMSFQKTEEIEANLHQIETLDNGIFIHYGKDVLQIRYYVLDKEKGYTGFDVLDGEENSLELLLDNEGWFYINDGRFEKIFISSMCFSDINDMYGFTVIIDDLNWNFTNQTGDNSYYYITNTGKMDKINSYDKDFSTKYYKSFSGRGYIWARTLPLLKKTFFIGTGPDTFILAYPNNDYVNNARYFGLNSIVTRPHNMYLQMAVQTGVLSLFSFLLFYFFYFFQSIKLYWNRKKETFEEIIGFGIFIGTIGFMIAGITNDSTVTVSPIFWCLMGMGIGINRRIGSISGIS